MAAPALSELGDGIERLLRLGMTRQEVSFNKRRKVVALSPMSESIPTAHKSGKLKPRGKLMPQNVVPYQWKKGVCPNPGGRPVSKPFTEAYNRIGHMTPAEYAAFEPSNAFEIRAFEMFKAAGANLVPATKEIAERVEGKVANQVEISGVVEHVLTEADLLEARNSIQRIQALGSDCETPAEAEYVDDVK